MHYKALPLAMAVAAAPMPAAAQIETIDPDVMADRSAKPADLADRLADPAVQEQMATTVAVLGDVLLDLPLAPLAKALADAGVEAADEIPGDTTLRKLAPGATRMQDELDRKLPQTMAAMAAMARGMEAVIPALKDMAEQVGRAVPAE